MNTEAKVSRIIKGESNCQDNKLGKMESMVMLLLVLDYYMVFYEI